ncbi:MAG: hypothetical protein WA399_00465 [Acidobacteriaceae bacterium]
MLLLLVGVNDPSGTKGLGGITRIQKLLYLLETEENIHPRGDGFEFVAYKAGPYSPKLYDDLEFLENLDFIGRTAPGETSDIPSDEAEPTFRDFDAGFSSPEATDAEKTEVDLSFAELMGPEDVIAPMPDEISPTPDSYQEARFYLTERGKHRLNELMQNKDYQPFVEGIRKVKSKFSKYSLNDLLFYVYTRHPDMTTESEIKEKVLRRRATH